MNTAKQRAVLTHIVYNIFCNKIQMETMVTTDDDERKA